LYFEEDLSVYTFGSNSEKQLGTGDYKSRNKPHFVMKDESIVSIGCGAHTSFILKGKLFKYHNLYFHFNYHNLYLFKIK